MAWQPVTRGCGLLPLVLALFLLCEVIWAQSTLGGNAVVFKSSSFTAGTEQPIRIGWSFPMKDMGVVIPCGHAFALDLASDFLAQSFGGAECHLYYGDRELPLEAPYALPIGIGEVTTRAYIFELSTAAGTDLQACPLGISVADAQLDPTVVSFECLLMRPRRFFPAPQFFLSTLNTIASPPTATTRRISSTILASQYFYPTFANLSIALDPPAFATYTNFTVTYTHNALEVPRGTGLSIMGPTSTTVFSLVPGETVCWVNSTLTTTVLLSSNRINLLIPFEIQGPATIQVTCAGLRILASARNANIWVEYFTTEGDSFTKGFYFAGGVIAFPDYPTSLTLNRAKFTFKTETEDSGMLVGTVTGSWSNGLGYPLRGGRDKFQIGLPSGFQPTYSSAVLGEEGSHCYMVVNDVTIPSDQVTQNLDLNTHYIELTLSHVTSVKPTDTLSISCSLIRSTHVLRAPSFDVKVWIYNTRYTNALTHSNLQNRLSSVAPTTHITGQIEASVLLSSSAVGTRTTMLANIANIPATMGKQLSFYISAPVFRPSVYSSSDFPVECLLKVGTTILTTLAEDVSTSAYDTTGTDDGLTYFTLKTDTTIDFPSPTRVTLACTNMVVYNRVRSGITTAGFFAIYEGTDLYAVKDGIQQPAATTGSLFSSSQTLITISGYAGSASPNSNKVLQFFFSVPFLLAANNGGAIVSLPSTYRLSLSTTPRRCQVTVQSITTVTAPQMLVSPAADRIYFYLPFATATVPFGEPIAISCPIVLPSTPTSGLLLDTLTVQVVDTKLTPQVNVLTYGTRTFTQLTTMTSTSLNRVDPLMDGGFCSSRCTFELSSPHPDELSELAIYMHPLDTGDITLTLAEDILLGPSMTSVLPNCTITADGIDVGWTLGYNPTNRAFTVTRTGSTASGPLSITCPNVRVSSNVIPAQSFIATSVGTTSNAYDAMTAPSVTARATTSTMVFSAPTGQPSALTLTITNAPTLPASLYRLLRVPLPVGTGSDPYVMGSVCTLQIDDTVITIPTSMVKHRSKLISELLIVIPNDTEAGKELIFTCVGFITPATTTLPFQSIDISTYSLARTPSRYTVLYSIPPPTVTIVAQPTIGKYLAVVIPESRMTISHSGSARFLLNPFPLALPARSQIIFGLPPSWNVPSTTPTGSTDRCSLKLAGTVVAGTVFARRLWDTSTNANGRDTTQWREIRFVTSVDTPAINDSLELECGKIAVPTVVTAEEYGYVTILAPDGALILSESHVRLPPIFKDQEGRSIILHNLVLDRRAPYTQLELTNVLASYQNALETASSVALAKQYVVDNKLNLELHVDVTGYHQPDGVVYLRKNKDSIATKMTSDGHPLLSHTSNIGYRIVDCYNNRKTRQETDRDCGGSDCVACSWGQSCLKDMDCLSLNCLNNKCADFGLTSGAAHVAGMGMVILVVLLALVGV